MNIRELKEDFTCIVKSKDLRNDLVELSKNEPTGIVSTLASLSNLARDVINIPNMLFYSKLERFLRGIDEIEYEKRIKLLSKFVNEQENNFVARMLYIIDKIDDDNKSLILASLYRNLCYENIDLGMFFRLCNIVNNTILEDLAYLMNNNHTNTFTLNLNIEALYNMCLIQKTSMGIENTYEISTLGNLLIQYGLSYGDLPSILKSQKVFFTQMPVKIVEPQIKAISIFA